MMFGSFFVRPRSVMAVQAFAIIEGRIEFDVLGLWDCPEILHEDVVHPAPFRLVIPEHCVIGMAGKTGVIARDKIVLKVLRRNEALIVHVETLPEIRHHMAGKAELRRSGALQVFVHARPHREHWQYAERYERDDFAAASPCEFRTQDNKKNENRDDYRECNQYQD
jgi:hypothetical protein